MAKKQIPDPLQRRHLVEADLAPAEASALAECYVAEGRSVEALVFLEKAEDRARLEALKEEAIEAGDVFLLHEVARCLGETPRASVWTRLADAAEAAGKERYALEARRQATARGD